MSFSDLRLAEPLLRALAAERYGAPTPIQAQAIPHLMAGRDVLGVAQTGTGKTAAFALPILHRLSYRPEGGRGPRALVLTPTRELAIQIGESFDTYGRHLKLRSAVVFGGVGRQPQIDALARGIDILVATPGRLLDLCAQKSLRFDRLSVLVLDEADRMLDMGFLPDVQRIVALVPKERQTLLFSATMPGGVARLAASLLRRPVRVEVAPSATVAPRIDQRVIFVPSAQKPPVLADLLRDPAVSRALVFSRTKHGANRIAERLVRADIGAEAIHSNKSQAARQQALGWFRSGRVRVLVATDIAARGIDVEGVSHVINFDIPNEPESYVHRIGRTARAGSSGVAISLCDASERTFIAEIEKLTRLRLQVVDHPRAEARPTLTTPAPRQAPRETPPQNERSGRGRLSQQRRAAGGAPNTPARAGR
ncbi:MAG TPA: DEAD/DEAH box helicase [Stellaceae bacterium]|nr:DEAD/DEAH box helicase [Stellaceae bacterium]